VSFQGFFELQTPVDLFRKLEHDLRRLKSEPLNAYAAFDFFVTAEHMLDWIHPNDKTARQIERDSNPLLQVCSHLANGSKHFQATSAHHQSVEDARLHEGAFSSGFDTGSFDVRSFGITRLEIQLKGGAEHTFGHALEATDLAQKILEYWRKRLGLGEQMPPAAD